MSNKKRRNFSKVLKGNSWAVSTIVLSVLLVISLIVILNVSATGAVVSPNQAGQNVLKFAISQGANAKLINASDSGSLYKIILSIEGKDGKSQEVPVYVTKDGKTLVPQPVPLTTTAAKKTSQSSTPTPTNIPKTDKPKVDLFVMAYCPYGTQMEKGILPVVKLLGDKIDFNIKFVYYSMHTSEGEVPEELRQYCIETEQNSKYLNYLKCFLEAGDTKGCLSKTNIDESNLSSCVATTDKKFNVMANLNDKSSWLNGRFPRFDIYKAENEKYKVAGSPTLIVNGVQASSGRDSSSLMKTICSAFKVAPSECNTKFTAGTPSPGFGFGTATTQNNAAAGCGA